MRINMMKNRPLSPFTSHQTKGEAIAALVYLPVHVLILPMLMGFVFARFMPGISTAAFNFIYYAIGIGYMLAFELKFLRRDFDPLCDRVLDCMIEILACYGIMLLLNLLMNGLLMLLLNLLNGFSFSFADNPNNAAVIDMTVTDMNSVSAMAVFIAPIVEELMFRAGVFGLLRRRSRILAYAVSILLFSLYHVWSFALADPYALIYIVQYIPATYVLCRCYERTNSIWGSIFLHMLINGLSMAAITTLGDYLCLIL